MRTFGIDVSHWEGKIDWHTATSSLNFAYFKCTDGIKVVDDMFAANQLGCSEAGIPHAPYHYFQPSLDPIAQADHFIAIAGKHFPRYILDVEAQARHPQITARLFAFLNRVQELTNVRPAIYTSAGYWNEYIYPKPAWAGEVDLVVAHYTSAHAPLIPIGWDSYVIWQFTDNWNFPGCNENADGDWFSGSLEQCRQWFGNYHLVQPPPPLSGLKMRALVHHLHIRQSPNMHARITGRLAKGEVVEVEQLGGDDAWVQHERGWSAIQLDGYRYMEVLK